MLVQLLMLYSRLVLIMLKRTILAYDCMYIVVLNSSLSKFAIMRILGIDGKLSTMRFSYIKLFDLEMTLKYPWRHLTSISY